MMKVLLDNGADIHSLNDAWIGECLSHRGKHLMLNNFQQAKFMAEILRKHNPSDINYSTWLGYTPLMYASFFNSPEFVKFLIKKGADIYARNIHGNDALTLAVTSDYNALDSDVILIFAEFGADIHDGLVSRAVEAGNVDAVKVLLSLGAKLPGQNATNDHDSHARKEKPCPKCGRIFERGNDYCPSCGYVLPVSERYGLAGRLC